MSWLAYNKPDSNAPKGWQNGQKNKEVSNLTPFQWLVTVFVGLSVAVSANKKILEAILVSVQNLAANSKQ